MGLFSGFGVKGFGDKSLGAGDQILGIENSFSVLLYWFVANVFQYLYVKKISRVGHAGHRDKSFLYPANSM